jgi:hypothetical protein
VSTPFLILVGGFLLLLLMLAAYINAPPFGDDDSEDDDRPAKPSYRNRVERHIRLLNYGDERTAADTTRQLLSMGPGILPVLLQQLLRLDQHPQSLSPSSQLLIEELLGDFGLQTYLQTADAVRSVHRASPAFPAVLRVLHGLGPHLVVELCRGTPPDIYGVCAPLIHRLGAGCNQQLVTLLTHDPARVPGEIVSAFIPLWAAEPDALLSVWGQVSPEARARIAPHVLAWNLPGADRVRREALEAGIIDAIPATIARQSSLRELIELGGQIRRLAPDLAAQLAVLTAAQEGTAVGDVELAFPLLDSPDSDARMRGTEGLLADLGDPRAVERLRLMAANPTDALGGLALNALASTSEIDLDAAFVARLRGAELTVAERAHLHLFVALRRPESIPLLLRLLRTDSPRTAVLVSELLSPFEIPIHLVLKALGRHRYSPIESSVAPLIWSRFPLAEAEVVECLSSDDREISSAAVDLLGGLGSPDCIPALGQRLRDANDQSGPILNALELLGPPAADKLREFSAENPELSQSLGVLRRRDLLLRLGQ